MTKFWGKLFLINFALGVVTGITLEFQFGTNWSRYSAYVGDIFVSFRLMVALGIYFLLMAIFGFFIRNRLMESPRYLKLMMWSLPLTYLAAEFGWLVAEIGRQPWIVYRLMHTANAVSPIDTIQVVMTLIGFFLVYGLLGAVDFYLLAKYARKGPTTEDSLVTESA